MDKESRAHLALLLTRVNQALNAQVIVPTK